MVHVWAGSFSFIKIHVSVYVCLGTPLHYISPPRDAIDATYRIVSDRLESFRIHSTSGVLFLKKSLDAEMKDYQIFAEVGARQTDRYQQ